MPSTSISEESVLFGPEGWRIAKELPDRCQILAVDRHGKVVQAAVDLSRTEKSSKLAFVGTGAAFGAVVKGTRVLASDGRRWSVQDIVEHGDTSSFQFENLTRMPGCVRPKPSINDLWQCLSGACAFGNSESVALRCRDPNFALDIKSKFPTKKQLGTHVYAIVRQDELKTALEVSWHEALRDLITCWLNNSCENRVEVERSAYYLALWLATALIESKAGYAFHFDTLQHTSYIFVEITRDAPRPLQRGACAFYTPYDSREISLGWNDSTLAPITGGFLLTAG